MSAPSVTLTKLTNSLSTKEAAFRALQDNRWVHFSCHGQQYFGEPFESCFAMRDFPLPLPDISACKTALGGSTVPDEVLHLAAGLQFTGGQSVVGPLWQLQDEVVFKVVSKFHEFRTGDRLGCTRMKMTPLQERTVSIHIGI
ncbi:hypothetical protein PAXRUDRAFT_30461 [Paxillus rubicundulus Ve08.2h10]|uniref:CHAT domain-containing protein n=1 Tax=Paxillus rubicundulus Ve08.2h10 TaxID=930991 RepID=A0A0D0ECK0_9AGAM|nr:hypothetical protein PAXRUDRAFT_30461 [Paxillus rubicundulus Ve08.2h10]